MNLSPGTTRLTIGERILALSIMLEGLKVEQRIDDWTRANPGATFWCQPEGRGRLYSIIRDGVLLASCKGVDADDARAQAFTVVFTNEAAALAE
ncbi:MAG TPA: hypothetical protein VGJ91_05105 [Polyangiaceae bacterium]|jgi:hypothetical protein